MIALNISSVPFSFLLYNTVSIMCMLYLFCCDIVLVYSVLPFSVFLNFTFSVLEFWVVISSSSDSFLAKSGVLMSPLFNLFLL
jgi:hypothetical protein